jgi:hypothetical protein
MTVEDYKIAITLLEGYKIHLERWIHNLVTAHVCTTCIK